MELLTRVATGVAHVLHRLTRQLPDHPYPSDHPWNVRHSVHTG